MTRKLYDGNTGTPGPSGGSPPLMSLLMNWNQQKGKTMKGFTIILIALVAMPSALFASATNDPGNRDALRISDLSFTEGVYRMAVEVVNDQGLAGLDIPLRFGHPGDPVTLEEVQWSDRVAGWDLRHAAIDNEQKTVILGLISDLLGQRGGTTLTASAGGETRIATLIFRVEGEYRPEFETFTTQRPGHYLAFLYNKYENGKPSVVEFSPEFGVSLSYKQSAVPRVYALSGNFPNPFNPATSFVLSLPEETNYTVTIYNVVGQVVKRFGGHSEAGEVRITWDGTNDQGTQVSSGVYFYRAEASHFTRTRRMVLVR